MKLPDVTVSRSHKDRVIMPQIQNVKAFAQWLRGQGVSYRWATIASEHLHPTQAKINLQRVVELIHKGLDFNKYPMVLDDKEDVLDGHHRWYAALITRRVVRALVVCREMPSLIRLVNEYPQTKTGSKL